MSNADVTGDTYASTVRASINRIVEASPRRNDPEWDEAAVASSASSVAPTIMRSVPSRRLLLLLWLTAIVEILHSLLLGKNAHVELLAVDRHSIDSDVRLRLGIPIPLRPPDFSSVYDHSLAHAAERQASHSALGTEVPLVSHAVGLIGTQVAIRIQRREEHEVVSRMGRMNVEDVQFGTSRAVAAVDVLLESLWRVR